MGSLAVFVDSKNIEILKPNNLYSNYSSLLHFNGLTQLLPTATRITIDFTTLIDHVFHNHFFDNFDCGKLDAGLTDYCAISVKLRFSCKNYDDTETTKKVFLSFLLKMQDKYI